MDGWLDHNKRNWSQLLNSHRGGGDTLPNFQLEGLSLNAHLCYCQCVMLLLLLLDFVVLLTTTVVSI